MIILQAAIDEYLLSGRVDGLSDATVRWYASLLLKFSAQFPRMTILDVCASDLRQYILRLREQPPYIAAKQKPVQHGTLSPATVNGHITALHAFWAWTAREYDIPNPMRNIKRPKPATPDPKAISPVDFVKLFNATGEDDAGVRDRAMLAFMADTGCRLGGLLGLKVSNLFINEGKAFIREKGNKTRMVPFTRPVSRLLYQWMSIRHATNEYVFVSATRGTPLTASGLNQVLKRLKARAGVQGRVNPHSFRHNFAREYIFNGGDIVTLAKLMGHTNTNVTAAYYAVFTENELKAFHEKFSPFQSMISKQK